MSMLTFDADEPDRDRILYGRLVVGDLSETFAATASVWSADEYRSHWRAAVARALENEDVALVVDWRPSNQTDGFSGAAFVMYWVNDQQIAIQNTLLVNDGFFRVPTAPSIDDMIVPPRSVHTEDGHPITEWRADRSELEALQRSLVG